MTEAEAEFYVEREYALTQFHNDFFATKPAASVMPQWPRQPGTDIPY
jgi:hypothetical protein